MIRESRPTPPALVAVAHGSRDPRSAATMSALVDEVRRQRPDLDVRLSFLDLNTPRLPEVLDAVAADGHRRVVVAPLLLGRAFHARVDVPSMVDRATRRHPRLRVTVADVLGADPRLLDAALGRLSDVVDRVDDPDLGVVLAAAGSRDARANAFVTSLATICGVRHPWRGAHAAFATTVSPSVPEAVAELRAHGARRIAVASWFLAPGRLPNRVIDAALAADADVRIADPLGADRRVAAVIVDRYLAAATESPLEHVS